MYDNFVSASQVIKLNMLYSVSEGIGQRERIGLHKGCPSCSLEVVHKNRNAVTSNFTLLISATCQACVFPLRRLT